MSETRSGEPVPQKPQQQLVRDAVQRFWLDETATASGRSVKVATAVVALLAAGGLVVGWPI